MSCYDKSNTAEIRHTTEGIWKGDPMGCPSLYAKCASCGIVLAPLMIYSCPKAHCPCGLGSAIGAGIGG